MSLLGEYRKQPVEVEVYAIQFAQDMSETDQIESAFVILSSDLAEPWDRVVQSIPYTALLTDNGKTLVSTSDITLPVDAPDGYRINVSNKSQVSAIFVGTISIPARGAAVILRSGGAWLVEAKTTSVLVDAPADQRVRVWVYDGTPWEVYKIQITVSTSEGRTMQDEFTVEIEEV